VHKFTAILTPNLISRSWYFSTSNISKIVQDRAISYNGRLIESWTQSIKWCHFPWPQMTPHLDFNSTSLLDAEYFRHTTRHRHSYYRPLTESDIWLVELCHCPGPGSNFINQWWFMTRIWKEGDLPSRSFKISLPKN